MKISFLKLKRKSKPTKAYKQALWTDLEIAFVKTYPAKTRFLWGKFVAVPALTMVLLVTTGTGVYAYSSPSVDAEDGLFVFKEGIESVELQFYRMAGGEYDFHERMLDRRFEEAELLYEAGELSDRHLEMIEMRLSMLEALAENVPELPEELILPEEVIEVLEGFEVVTEDDEMTDQERRHHRYEEMRNVLHGERVHDDEARISDEDGDEEDVELYLRPPHESRRMEALR
jgi:hypothetical protein